MGGSAPDTPDYAKIASEAKVAEFEASQVALQIDAAAKLGKSITIDGETYDFTGLGDADVAAQYSDAMAAAFLKIQKDYGSQFVDSALDQLRAADPEAFAAREQLWERVKTQAEESPDRPIAETAQARALELLEKGSSLDDRQQRTVREGVRTNQARRGNYLGNSAATQEAGAMVQAGDNARQSRQQMALQFLQSGTSPEDVEYRRMQQSLGNISSFLNNQTPQSQFSSLSSAGGGAAPYTTASYGYQNNPNTIPSAMNNALSIYDAQNSAYQNSVNPWVAGAGFGIQGLGTLANLGAFSGGGAGVSNGFGGSASYFNANANIA